MTKKVFDEFVARQMSEPENEIDWTTERDEWLVYVDKFYREVEVFLKEYLDKKQISIVYDRKKISEEHIGEYEVERGIIQLGRHQIRLEPVGTNLIGAKGRIDMIGPFGKVMFLLVNKDASKPVVIRPISIGERVPLPVIKKPEKIKWTWKISTPPPNIMFVELKQESFFDAFMEVTNG